ncbi:hypothetical protein GQ55_8G177000 [Panicum hallii var. hallii]|uniref:Myb/SANT-like domain-containing protein n=1 Tax=Panicum hallii var. hallii TaxID=1504633 RepID=A0A2T7CNN1_9POAL|nr:hypothetical protein GQ55_8G177000 [Panicum hallii var. hallii]
MREKYLELSGLRHSTKQLRNRWTQLKSLCTSWLMLNNHTTFGQGPQGEIIASEKTWKEACKKQPERKKFKYRVPLYIDQMSEMFHGVAVDGSSSYVPGEVDLAGHDEDGDDSNGGDGDGYEDGDGDRDGDGDGFENSQMSLNSRKRGSSTTDTASSPNKKSKSLMVKLMKGLIQEFKHEREESKLLSQQLVTQQERAQERAQQRLEEEMAYCRSLAVECGATEESVEYWVASKLFEKQSQRAFFKNIKIKKASFMRLKRHRQNMKMY